MSELAQQHHPRTLLGAARLMLLRVDGAEGQRQKAHAARMLGYELREDGGAASSAVPDIGADGRIPGRTLAGLSGA